MFKLTLIAAIVAATFGGVAAPATAAQVGVTLNVAPPPQQDEVVPAARRGYEWSAGYWNWDRNRDGIRNRNDRDRDGDRDRDRDRDGDGDGVPNRRDNAPNTPRRN